MQQHPVIHFGKRGAAQEMASKQGGTFSSILTTANSADHIGCAENSRNNDMVSRGLYKEHAHAFSALQAVDSADEIINLINTALRENDDAWAEMASARLIELRKENRAAAYLEVGQIYFKWKRSREALAAVTEARRLEPKSHKILFQLAIVYQHFGWYAAAEKIYAELLHEVPIFVGTLINSGTCLTALGQVRLAINRLEQALVVDPANEDALCNLIMALICAGRMEDAGRRISDLKTRTSSRSKMAFINALYLEREGKHDEAVALLEPLLESTGSWSIITAFGVSIKYASKTRVLRAVRHIERWCDGRGLPVAVPEHKALLFALGDLHDKLGDYDSAFACYKRANELMPPRFNRDMLSNLLGMLRKHGSKSGYCGQSRLSRQMIFIVGMPRSGTSLMERIITTSDLICGAGELSGIGRIASAMTSGKIEEYPRALSSIGRREAENYIKQYQAEIESLSADVKIVDKMPSNWQFIGLIMTLFPDSKIIYMKRDYRDVCLSCYRHEFSGVHPYKYCLSDLIFYYRKHEEVMDYWMENYGGSILTVEYEDVVANFGPASSKVFRFIGVPHVADVDKFYLAQKSCLTASYDEVRRPLYATSVGRWRNYEKHLKEILEKRDELV